MLEVKGESSPNPTRKARVENAVDKVMIGLQERRERLGMVGLPESQAQLRARAIETIPADAFMKLLSIEDDGIREAQIRALVEAQRHKHVLIEIRPVARSIYDDRILFRWFCECGREASGDYFSAQDARDGWQRHHDGRLAKGFERCQHCGRAFKDEKGNRHCSADCRVGTTPLPPAGLRRCSLVSCETMFPGRADHENFCCQSHRLIYREAL